MSTIYADNIQPNLGSGVSIPGHVVQVVDATDQMSTSNVLITGGSYSDVLEASITPKSADSKILIMWNQDYRLDNGASRVNGSVRVYNNTSSTTVINSEGGNESLQYRMTGNYVTEMNFVLMSTGYDSPNSTSAQTYKFQAKIEGGAGRILFFPRYHGSTNITLMEIAQ